jgi:hypothetical protein
MSQKVIQTSTKGKSQYVNISVTDPEDVKGNRARLYRALQAMKGILVFSLKIGFEANRG